MKLGYMATTRTRIEDGERAENGQLCSILLREAAGGTVGKATLNLSVMLLPLGAVRSSRSRRSCSHARKRVDLLRLKEFSAGWWEVLLTQFRGEGFTVGAVYFAC